MKIAVLGTGVVGTTLASKLLTGGHEVVLGSRSAENEKGQAWLASVNSPRASLRSFAEAALGADLVINATLGMASLAALSAVGAETLAGKILVDVSNPLDFSAGMPPRLSVCNDSSLAEEIQQAFPKTRVVKTLNTVSCTVMVAPERLPAKTTLFIAGNDNEAKNFVEMNLLREALGWSEIVDLGKINAARGMEMYLALWVRMYGALHTADFNIAIVQKD